MATETSRWSYEPSTRHQGYFNIVDLLRPVNGKPGIIANTHDEKWAKYIVKALNANREERKYDYDVR